MSIRILIVPDKFKGAAPASDVADAIELFLRRRFVRGCDEKHLIIEKLPLADGGDGSMEVLRSALGFRCRIAEVACEDALGRPIKAPILLNADTAFIEMAQVCGLAMLSREERNPEKTTTRGLGQLMLEAARLGAGRIIIGLGGSATNDCGAGMLETCPPSALKGISLMAACDVENPLLGPDGATMVYGPQKGADGAMLARLEQRVEEFAASRGIDPLVPGGGAAGGVGACLHSLYGAHLTPGWKLFGDMVALEEKIAAADLVITAEGRVDAQSLSGKLLAGISSLCIKYRKVLKVVCGKNYLHPRFWRKAGIYDILALHEVEPDKRKSIEGTERLLSGRGLLLAGCDEAGRGCLAGPVFAAAVILPEDFYDERLNDSKQMTEADRDALRERIEAEALAWKVVAVQASEIDRINILNASVAGMQRALDGLSVRPQAVFVDGNRFSPYFDPDGRKVPFHCVVHGDARIAAIAAASVLAKTHRDEYMRRISAEYPQYGWDRNMAYPTAEHRDAIRRYGITPYHRRSFALRDSDSSLNGNNLFERGSDASFVRDSDASVIPGSDPSFVRGSDPSVIPGSDRESPDNNTLF